MKSLPFLTFLFLAIISSAQINPKTKWGDVSQAEIDFKTVSFEPEAGAVILFEEGKTMIGGVIETKIYKRIKILNERGIEAANQELVFYSENKKEAIQNIKAQTLNIENGQIKSYPVDKNSIFDVNINEAYSSKKFTFPNVKVGSILEFEYDFYDNDVYLIDIWRFQHEIPTLFSQYSLTNDTYREYTLLMVGEKTVKYSKNNNPKEISKWSLLNLPSYTSIPYLYNPADMAEGIVLQLKGYYTDSKTAFNEIVFKEAISSWGALVKELKNNYNGFTNASLGKEIATTIANGKNEVETLKNVHDYFSQNYRWNNFYAVFPRKTNREVQNGKTGNAADLNLLLNSILNGKGFKAELVAISTRDHGKLIINYPYLGQFNSIVNMVSLKDGSTVFMDAANLNTGLGFMPLYDYNHYGLILDGNGESFANVAQQVSEFNSNQIYSFKENKFLMSRSDKFNGFFLEQSKIELPKGQAEYSAVGNALDLLMNEIKKDTKSEGDTQMERRLYESNPIGSGFITINNPLKDVVSYFKLPEETRERPLEFNFPFYYKTDVVIPVPDGYSAQIPTDFGARVEISSGELKYFQSAELKDDKVILHVEFLLTKAAFSYKYKEIKAFFEKANQAVNKSILLKK